MKRLLAIALIAVSLAGCVGADIAYSVVTAITQQDDSVEAVKDR